MKLLLLSVLILAGCNLGGSPSGSTGADQSPVVVQDMSFAYSAPTSVYYSASYDSSPTVDVTIRNIGNSGNYTNLKWFKDGVQMQSPFIPTLNPGESFVAQIHLWNAAGQAGDHLIELQADPQGWYTSFTVRYVGATWN
jgi:hypothetical protein